MRCESRFCILSISCCSFCSFTTSNKRCFRYLGQRKYWNKVNLIWLFFFTMQRIFETVPCEHKQIYKICSHLMIKMILSHTHTHIYQALFPLFSIERFVTIMILTANKFYEIFINKMLWIPKWNWKIPEMLVVQSIKWVQHSVYAYAAYTDTQAKPGWHSTKVWINWCWNREGTEQWQNKCNGYQEMICLWGAFQ